MVVITATVLAVATAVIAGIGVAVGVPAAVKNIVDLYRTLRPNTVPLVLKRNAKDVRKEVEAVKKKLGMDVHNRYGFAIAGLAGAGKSSLINALRGLRNDDKDAAPVGVTESTSEVTRYAFSDHPIDLYDIPGAGTRKTGADAHAYFKEQKLVAMDAIVLVYHGRLMDLSIGLCAEALSYEVPLIVVRSKSDADIQNLLDDYPNLTPASAAKKLKDSVSKEFLDVSQVLKVPRKELPCFLLSSKVLLRGVGKDLPKQLVQMDELEFVAFMLEVAERNRRELGVN